MIHTILGAGGPVSNALASQLQNNTATLRLVSRRPIAATGATSWTRADLTNYDETLAAAKGSDVIYLCAGLAYDKNIWREQWPKVMNNAISAAKQNNARLIFFDNVYSYGLVNGPMTEDTPYNPVSVKGEIRAKIATQLMEEAKAGNIKASILRGADFYGAETLNSLYDLMVLAKYAKKEKAQWVGDVSKLHVFTYIPDAGKAMYLLGQHPESDNQIWHAPTAAPLSGDQFIKLAADVFGVKASYMSINKLMMRIFGLFNKNVGEMVEMYYQYDHDYIFNSDKFEKAFNVKPTAYRDGIVQLKDTMFKGE